MTCLLGLCDSMVSSYSIESQQTNKIGGAPNWPVNVKVSTPRCQVCDRVQTLVVQLYCCLEKSLYHRTLYVFACCNPSCWNNQQSWTVYRCQTSDSCSQHPVMSRSHSDQRENADNDWNSDADNWGIEADDCGKGADNWGKGDDDWGKGDDDWGKGADNWGKGADDWVEADDWGKGDAGVIGARATLSRDYIGNDQDDEVTSATLKSKSDLKLHNSDPDCMNMKKLCIDDVTDDESFTNTDEKLDTNSHVFSEEMPSLSEQEKSNFLNTFQTSSLHENDHDPILESYFINVFEEPSTQVNDNYHVAKLLRDYQKREGYNVKDLVEGFSCEGGSKSEQYEKTSLLHRDFIFHKFMKRLSLCPEQCIRYQWNGSPLFNSCVMNNVPSACCHCGGEVVFELQLTPALINHLKFPHHKESAIEFGTVLVYTCRESCWEQTATFKVEQVLMQPDPDQHLFKNNQT